MYALAAAHAVERPASTARNRPGSPPGQPGFHVGGQMPIFIAAVSPVLQSALWYIADLPPPVFTF